MNVNEMIFYERYGEMVNTMFSTNLPWCEDPIIHLAYDYCFEVYKSLENLKKNCSLDDEEINDMFQNDTLAYIGGMFVKFNEVNYDYNTELPIGDFTEEELKRIKQLQGMYEIYCYEMDDIYNSFPELDKALYSDSSPYIEEEIEID